ncbi:Na(+)/H(+) antiporter subunit C [Nocardioides seonyuensis]|uniref:Na(+)/H(+) antiporter subunit C n=1 Tax=Nocardioides seonyuensis TaxID=2518371 RepID=A0A4P7IFK8_9ACTN|nr:Na(+)/H(+) antiporter subunit C [Nocardioides seonyuensis]QBX56026.1 Na(+)/H(+) antiporter subunit C [Nocardioides seonyuensis]
MTASLSLILPAAAMIGCGVYLVLERSLTRVLVGLVMLTNGVNLLFLVSGGEAGRAPIVSETDTSAMSDPLPQALVLTAIVISLGTTAFLLAMAYRSWQLTGHDDVQDDVEDAAIRRLAAADESSDSYDLSAQGELAEDDVPAEEGDEEVSPR